MNSSVLEIEHVPIEDLMPHVRNSRLHPLWQIAQISASISEFGFVNPCLIDEQGTIIAGHGRVQAALKLDMKTVPCIRLVGLSEIDKRRFLLIDNRLTENGGWDQEMLKLELGELRGEGVDLAGLGWSEIDLAGIGIGAEPQTGGDAPNEGLTDPDDAPAPETVPARTKRGDLWLLGPYLECDECGAKFDYDPALADKECPKCFA